MLGQCWSADCHTAPQQSALTCKCGRKDQTFFNDSRRGREIKLINNVGNTITGDQDNSYHSLCNELLALRWYLVLEELFVKVFFI